MDNKLITIKSNKEVKGIKYFLMALLCFGGLEFDGLATFLDYLVFGDKVTGGF